MDAPGSPSAARRTIGFWDLVLYTAALTLSLRWFSTAAAAGPASLPIWALAALLFLGPLAIASAELTGRFEGEGAIYAWTREALGPFAGFVCAWLYWTCNLPYFAGAFYFIADVLTGAFGPKLEPGQTQILTYLAISIGLALLVAFMHLAGLGVGKWLPSFGAVSTIVLVALLLFAGGAAFFSGNSATDFAHVSYAPPINSNGAILWATMVFAFAGAEGAATLRNEVKGGMSTIMRAIAVVGVILALAYISGSAAILSILPTGEASRLSGLKDALAFSFARMHLEALTPFALALMALSLLGAASAWFGVAARLPFAVGVDRMLPSGFSRRDPKTGAPSVAIWTQTFMVIALMVLGQAGTTLAGAYDFLVSMSVLSYTLPFLFLFATFFQVQSSAPPSGVWTAPGGRTGARFIAAVGFLTALSAALCSLTPSPDATNPAAEFRKILVSAAVLIAAGVGLYLFANARKRASEAPNA